MAQSVCFDMIAASSVVTRCWPVLVALLLAACMSGAEQRQESRATTWRPVATWSGRDTTTLETFPIGAGRLRIFWDVRSASAAGPAKLRVRLHSADSGRVLEEIVDMTGVGAGSRDVFDDHQRFYLSVEST